MSSHETRSQRNYRNNKQRIGNAVQGALGTCKSSVIDSDPRRCHLDSEITRATENKNAFEQYLKNMGYEGCPSHLFERRATIYRTLQNFMDARNAIVEKQVRQKPHDLSVMEVVPAHLYDDQTEGEILAATGNRNDERSKVRLSELWLSFGDPGYSPTTASLYLKTNREEGRSIVRHILRLSNEMG